MNTAIMDSPEVLAFLFHPEMAHTSPPPEGASDIDVTVAEDARISCRLYGTTPEHSTLLFFHGNGECIADYDEIGPRYNEVGLNLLVTEYRGYGNSTGTPTSSSMLRDAETLYTALRTHLTDLGFTGALFLMGRSLGSACAIHLAALKNDEINGLIIDSGFAETLPLAETLGLQMDGVEISEEETFNNRGKIEQVTRPTFLLHGRMDDLIPVWQAEKLMAACGARSKELQIIPGADHNSLMAVGGPLYFQVIRHFTDKATGADDWRARRRARRG